MRYLTNSILLVLLAGTNLTIQTPLDATHDRDNSGNFDAHDDPQDLDLDAKNTTKMDEKEGSINGKFELEERLTSGQADFRQEEIDEAVMEGFGAMHELYSIKEPLLYKMGFFLDPNEPAAKLAAFKEPRIQAILQAKYGYAAVQAAVHLAQKNSLKLSRQNQEFPGDIFSDLLAQQCPFKGAPRCTGAAKRYRTADGTCNNPRRPWLGSALSPLHRFLPPAYEDGIQSERRSTFGTPLPSARRISITIHHERNVEMPAVSLMFMQWGQFLDHDVISTVSSRAFNSSIPRCCLPGGIGFLPLEFLHPECMPISVPEDDEFFGRFSVRCMEFVRSAPASRIDCKLGWREQITQTTSFIDASMIYGGDIQRSESLRTFKNGELVFGSNRRNDHCKFGTISPQCFTGGDTRYSEQPALTALHTIWVKFHNKVARNLQEINPHWSDEKLYQEARSIIGALVQHITYREFLPIVLGPEVMELFELKLLRRGFYEGYDESVNPSTSNAFSTAAFRFGHSLVQNSFVRTTMDHKIIPNNVTIHEEPENFENTLTPGSLDRLILGLINQPSQMRDEFISEELTNHLFQSPNSFFGIDLAAVNIQRGRDHGVPSYTSWRTPCGLTPIRRWSDLLKVMPKRTVAVFRTLYEDVDDIDLYSGGLAERPVRGGLVGPVFACIIAQQFLNYKKGDRFWYENGGFKSSFGLAQLNQIRKVSLAEVICHSLGEVETVQSFVLLMVDEEKNPRKNCEEIIFDGLNLRDWEDDFRPFEVETNHRWEELNTIDFDDPSKLRKREVDSRHIGEYIMETFDDYYESYDYEENVKIPQKKKKNPTGKPNKKTTSIPFHISKSPEDDNWEELPQLPTEIPQKVPEPIYNDTKFDLIHKNFVPLKITEQDEDVLVLHDFHKNDPRFKINDKQNPNYEVNINIKYILSSGVEKTTMRNRLETKRPLLDNTKPFLDNTKLFLGNPRPILDQDRPYLDNKRPYLDNQRPYLDNKRPYFDNNRPIDNTKPLVSINLLQSSHEQTSQKPQNYPIYFLNSKTTTKPEPHVTGYQIKKTTTKKYYDVPIYVSSNSYTTKPNVQNVDYDPVYEDLTTKRPYRPNFQTFPTNKPVFSNQRPLTDRLGSVTTRPNGFYDFNPIGTVNSGPIYVKDPIDDVYMTILQKPTTNFQSYNLQIRDESTHIDDKLDFKSGLLPHKLKVKNTNMVKIYSIKSSSLERSSDGPEAKESKELFLPELDGTKIVQIDVLPSEAKFSTKQTDEKNKEITMPYLNISNMEHTVEFPRRISYKNRTIGV